jgi:type VI secretion system secreted protein Hcp
MAFDAFLKIDGIMGESRAGEIRLESFSWGVSNSSSSASGGSGAGEGKASFQDFSFAALIGRQSPKLFEAAAKGMHIKFATLTVTDKIEPLTIKFSDVFISSYKLDEGAIKLSEGALRAAELGPPMESVSFNFARVEFQASGNLGTSDVR